MIGKRQAPGRSRNTADAFQEKNSLFVVKFSYFVAFYTFLPLYLFDLKVKIGA